MRHAFAVLVMLASCGCAGADEQKVVEQFKIRGTVQDVIIMGEFKGSVIPTHFDPRFILALRIESVAPSLPGVAKGAVVNFAIHSPTRLFAGETPKGKTLDFVLSRETEAGQSRFFGFAVERKSDP